MGGSGPSGKQPMGSAISGAGPPLGATKGYIYIYVYVYIYIIIYVYPDQLNSYVLALRCSLGIPQMGHERINNWHPLVNHRQSTRKCGNVVWDLESDKELGTAGGTGVSPAGPNMSLSDYPLVICHITIGNHHA